jgi:hypothetical protein
VQQVPQAQPLKGTICRSRQHRSSEHIATQVNGPIASRLCQVVGDDAPSLPGDSASTLADQLVTEQVLDRPGHMRLRHIEALRQSALAEAPWNLVLRIVLWSILESEQHSLTIGDARSLVHLIAEPCTLAMVDEAAGARGAERSEIL